jgi:alpha-beta hydrolase superfamily lysophospholipase
VVPDVIYPERIDSLYVKKQEQQLLQGDSSVVEKGAPVFVYNPGSLNMPYEDIEVRAVDSAVLKAWYIPSDNEQNFIVLILHDLNESRIGCLGLAKALQGRNIDVCLMDLRGHGSSGGNEFSPGQLAVDDVRAVIDELFSEYYVEQLAILGIGTGTAIAVQAAAQDDRVSAIVLQSPFLSLDKYVERRYRGKWWFLNPVYSYIANRRLKKQLGYPPENINLPDICEYIFIPTLVIAGSNDTEIPYMESLRVSEASGSDMKNFITITDAGHHEIAEKGGEAYYDAISFFLHQAVPAEVERVRKKVARND